MRSLENGVNYAKCTFQIDFELHKLRLQTYQQSMIYMYTKGDIMRRKRIKEMSGKSEFTVDLIEKPFCHWFLFSCFGNFV